MHNIISHIQDENGNNMREHTEKDTSLWRCYKNRMGVSFPTNNNMELMELLPEVDTLQSLDSPITEEEIYGLVKFLIPYKAPGPDGFNGFFVKNACISSRKISSSYAFECQLGSMPFTFWIYPWALLNPLSRISQQLLT